MGARYNYQGVFRIADAAWNSPGFILSGFAALWDRIGMPSTVSRQEFVKRVVENEAFTEQKALDALPVEDSRLLVIYSENSPTGCLVLAASGPWLIAGASLPVSFFDEADRESVFRSLRSSLSKYGLCAMFSGNEVEIDRDFLHELSVRCAELCRRVGVDRYFVEQVNKKGFGLF